MTFKVFKQSGNDVIFNLDKIIFIRKDEISGKTVIYSTTHSNEVDEPFEEVKRLLGAGRQKEVGY